jgi:hypothetical protein
MKETTKNTMDFLYLQIFPLFSKFTRTKFSTNSFHFLEHLFEDFINANKKWDKIKHHITFTVHNELITSKGIHGKLYDSILPFAKKEINEFDNRIFVYDFHMHFNDKTKKEIKVSIFGSNEMEIKKYEYIKKIYIWLSVAFLYAHRNCSQKLEIYLYLTDLEKKIPKMREPISQMHANTAFTTSCNISTEINIYRKEEWFKVFIHETFHSLGLDFSAMHMHHEKIDKKVLNIFPVKSDVRLYETYCETWANLLNCMFYSFFSTRKNDEKENIPKIIKKTEKLLNYERIFSLFQMCKVLLNYRMTYHELYNIDIGSHEKRMKHYKEETNVLSYYILKCIYFYFIDDFVHWCYIYNRGYNINFNKDNNFIVNNLDKYVSFIREHYLNNEFVENILIIEKWLLSNGKMKKYQGIMNTMRMTVIE